MTKKPKLTATGFPETLRTSLKERFFAGSSKKIPSDLGRISAGGTNLRANSFDRMKKRQRLIIIQTMLASERAEIRIDDHDSAGPQVLLRDSEEQVNISELLGEGARIRRKRLEKDGGDEIYEVVQGIKEVKHGPNRGSYRLLIQNEGGGQTSINPSELAGPPNERDAEAGRMWRLELPRLPE